MKGLIRNNFYSVEGTLKGLFFIMFLGIISIFVFPMLFPKFEFPVLFIWIGAFVGAGSSLPFTLVYNDGMSKWSKFELTSPISKGDVMKSRYITFLMFAMIILICSLISFAIDSTLNNTLDFDKIGYLAVYGVSFLIFAPSIFHPLVLIFGVDKAQLIFLVSMPVTFAYFWGSAELFKYLFPQITSNTTYRIFMTTLSILIFFISYLISRKIYIKKDL